jgi:SAM-dependent methyltransferase
MPPPSPADNGRVSVTTPRGRGQRLSFPEILDVYQQAIYDVDVLANSIWKQIEQLGCGTRIIDCAAGTGFPALALRKLARDSGNEVHIECADGDAEMLAQLQRNAASVGVPGECERRDWLAFADREAEYDYLMCRGNSLVYGTSWAGGPSVAGIDDIRSYIECFATAISPGGYLHFDAPWALALPGSDRSFERSDRKLVEIRATDDGQLSIWEEVEDLETSRSWKCSIIVRPGSSVPPGEYGFELHSSRSTVYDFLPLLRPAGFDRFEVFQMEGTRPNHATVLARRSPT